SIFQGFLLLQRASLRAWSRRSSSYSRCSDMLPKLTAEERECDEPAIEWRKDGTTYAETTARCTTEGTGGAKPRDGDDHFPIGDHRLLLVELDRDLRPAAPAF